MIKLVFFLDLFTISAQRNVYIKKINVVTVFLKKNLDENIHLIQSKDFTVDLIYVYCLIRVFYDFKQKSQI